MNNTYFSILTLCATVLLASCTPSTSLVTDQDLKIPGELSDCKFFWMTDKSGSGYLVVRCPNSTTSTNSLGKHKKRVIVVDGVEYESIE